MCVCVPSSDSVLRILKVLRVLKRKFSNFKFRVTLYQTTESSNNVQDEKSHFQLIVDVFVSRYMAFFYGHLVQNTLSSKNMDLLVEKSNFQSSTVLLDAPFWYQLITNPNMNSIIGSYYIRVYAYTQRVFLISILDKYQVAYIVLLVLFWF